MPPCSRSAPCSKVHVWQHTAQSVSPMPELSGLHGLCITSNFPWVMRTPYSMTFTSTTCFAAVRKEEGLHSQTMEILAVVFPTVGLSTYYKWMKQGDLKAMWGHVLTTSQVWMQLAWPLLHVVPIRPVISQSLHHCIYWSRNALKGGKGGWSNLRNWKVSTMRARKRKIPPQSNIQLNLPD